MYRCSSTFSENTVFITFNSVTDSDTRDTKHQQFEESHRIVPQFTMKPVSYVARYYVDRNVAPTRNMVENSLPPWNLLRTWV